MLDDRFGELARKPDAKFLGAGANDQSINPGRGRASCSPRAFRTARSTTGSRRSPSRPSGRASSASAQSEIDRARKSVAAVYEQIYAEREKSESGSFAQELLNLFLENEPAPGIEYEYRLVKQILPLITTDEISAMARTLMADDGRVVLAVSPQKDGLQAPTEAGVRAALGVGGGGRGHRVERHVHDQGARRDQAAARGDRRRAARSRKSVSRSSASKTASRPG